MCALVKSKESRIPDRLEILVDQAITNDWPMARLAGLLSKPKRIVKNADYSYLEIPEEDDSRD